MSKDKKTHWRSIDKSDHFGAVDLDELGGNYTATIISVKFENTIVAGKKGIYRIARFKENLKPMVINVVNGKAIQRALKSKYIQDWENINVEVDMYVKENEKFGRDLVDCVRFRAARIKTNEPKEKHVLTDKRFQDALKSILEGNMTGAQLSAKYKLTAEQIKQI